MIGKIFKFVGITIVAFVLLFFVFVNTALFDRFLANQIKDKVLFSTGLELNFSKFYVSFFKGKLECDNVTLGNVLKIKKIDIDLSSLKLLLAKLDIERARVYGVTINIDRDFKIKSFSKNPKELDKNGFETIIVRDFRLEDVNVRFSDREGNVASFVSKDFLIQAGFDDNRGSYSGVIAFNNGQVVYNNNPYLLNVACYFDFNEEAITIKELSITSGGLKLKSKGKFAKNKTEISIEGNADLFELTKIEELKGVNVKFDVSGDLTILKGNVVISDGKRKAAGVLVIDIAEKKIKIENLKGNFKEHLVSIDSALSFKKKLKISLNSSIKGKYLKNFHINLDIVKDKEWNYNAHFYGVDCGNGVCGVKIISGKTPKLSTVKLNLPILKTNIENNSGWIDLNFKDARIFAHGNFFKNDNLFSGLLTVKKLNLFGLNFPQMDLNVQVKSKDYVIFKSILLKDGEGIARLQGEYNKYELNFDGKLEKFPFKKALFFLDKETLNEVEIFGAVDGRVAIKGKYDNPEVKGFVALLHSNIYGLYFPVVESEFVYANSRLKLKNTILEAGEGSLEGGGVIDFQKEKIELGFEGKGVELNYIPLEDLYAEQSSGKIKIYGDLTNPEINANFFIGDVVFSDLSFGSGEFKLCMKNGDVNINFNLKNGLSGSGLVKGGDVLEFAFKAKNFIYKNEDSKIRLSGRFNFSGLVDSLDSLKGDGYITELTVKKGNLLTLSSNGVVFGMKGMNLFSKKIMLSQLNPSLEINISDVVVNMDKDELAAKVNVKGDASFVNKILKQQEIEGVYVSGNIESNLKLYGVVYSPFYLGDVFYKGSIDLKDAGYVVKNADLRATINYDVFEIQSFKGEIKQGFVELKGTVIGSDVDLQAKINNIPIDVPGFYADANGVLFLKTIEKTDRYKASGFVELKNGILNVEQMLTGEEEIGFLDKVELDLNTSLEGVAYSDKDITLIFGKSNLKMIGTASNPILSGVQYISRDSYLNIGDNRFFVNRGKLVFNNPLENNPFVDIVASANLNDYKVRCLLKGSSDKINIKFLSDPPMSQNKILSVLFGGGINTGVYNFYNSGESENLSGVGAALALNTILSSFNNKMKNALKVDRFSISSQVFDVTRSPSPLMSFEKSLSSRLSFLYAQSLDTGANLIELSYHMAGKRNVYIRNEIDGSITIEFEIIK